MSIGRILARGAAAAVVGAFAAGSAAAGVLELPIVQRPFEHEEEQFGYDPAYTVNIPSFDSQNRPYIRSRGQDIHETEYIHTLRDGEWVERPFLDTVKEAVPDFVRFHNAGGFNGGAVVFDADDALYTCLEVRREGGGRQQLLLYSPDYGKSFQVYELPGDQMSIEKWTGHNELSHPPLIQVLEHRADHELGRWTAHYDLYIIEPRKQDGGLYLEKTGPVTNNGLSISRHSGDASFAASHGNRGFIVWAETTDTNEVPGAPTYVATYDRTTNEVTGKQHAGYGFPPNNGHNTPGITLDDRGILHVLTGSHGEQFMYSHSVEPYSTEGGWSEPEPMLTTGWREEDRERGRQTYVGLVAGPEGALHTVFRQWRRQVDEHFEDSYYGALSYMRKKAGDDWPGEAQVLVVPPTGAYSIYYHKLSRDRAGRLFATYSYRSNAGLYYEHEEGRYHYKALIMSDDGGTSWRLAATGDFLRGMEAGG